MEEYLQLVSLPATECEEMQNIPTTSPSAIPDEAILMHWSDEIVKLLIALYQEHERKFADVNYKNKCLGNYSSRNEGKGYCPTWVQCSNKWKQLKKSFLEVKDNKRATKQGTKTHMVLNLGSVFASHRLCQGLTP